MNKTPSLFLRLRSGFLLALLSMMLFSCVKSENPAQRKAWDSAVEKEKTYAVETAETIIAEYRKVIAIEPGTPLAKEAEKRLKAVEQRLKADERHISVFQEHGID
ncbi:MAG: hypothetical protein ABQ298_13215 [Puniceicoccaceae bacterium]